MNDRNKEMMEYTYETFYRMVKVFDDRWNQLKEREPISAELQITMLNSTAEAFYHLLHDTSVDFMYKLDFPKEFIEHYKECSLRRLAK